jgi:hypothetical protein
MTALETYPWYRGDDGALRYVTYDDLPADAYGIWNYWSKDGRGIHFQFELVPCGDHVRIYILQQPGYAGWPDDSASTHRLVDGGGRNYVCITHAHRPRDTREALTWAVGWAEGTLQYIDSGRPFS